MDKPIENFWQIRLADVKTALEANNLEVFLAEKEEDVHKIVLEDLIPQLKPQTVSWGGSMTFTGSGLYKKLKDRSDIEVWDTFAGKISDDEKNQRRRQALHADLFISGSTGPLHIAGALDRATAAFYPRRRSATPLRWQTLSADHHRLEFCPSVEAEESDMQSIDIQQAAMEISNTLL